MPAKRKGGKQGSVEAGTVKRKRNDRKKGPSETDKVATPASLDDEMDRYFSRVSAAAGWRGFPHYVIDVDLLTRGRSA